MKKIVYSAIAYLFPAVALAQTLSFENLNGPISSLGTIINRIIPIVIGLAVLAFLWGVLRYVIAQEDPEERAKARWFMVWGIVALFVMVSVWGLVRILQNTLGVTGTAAPGWPTIPGTVW